MPRAVVAHCGELLLERVDLPLDGREERAGAEPFAKFGGLAVLLLDLPGERLHPALQLVERAELVFVAAPLRRLGLHLLEPLGVERQVEEAVGELRALGAEVGSEGVVVELAVEVGGALALLGDGGFGFLGGGEVGLHGREVVGDAVGLPDLPRDLAEVREQSLAVLLPLLAAAVDVGDRSDERGALVGVGLLDGLPVLRRERRTARRARLRGELAEPGHLRVHGLDLALEPLALALEPFEFCFNPAPLLADVALLALQLLHCGDALAKPPGPLTQPRQCLGRRLRLAHLLLELDDGRLQRPALARELLVDGRETGLDPLPLVPPPAESLHLALCFQRLVEPALCRRPLDEPPLGLVACAPVRLEFGFDFREPRFGLHALALELDLLFAELRVEAALEIGFVVPPPALAEERFVAGVVAADRLALRDERFRLSDARAESLALAFEFALAGGEPLAPHPLLLDRLRERVEFGDLLGQRLLVALGLGPLSFEVGDDLLQLGALVLPLPLVFERGNEPLDLALGVLGLLVRRREPGAGDGSEPLVAVEPEDAPEHLLPIAGLLFGELVGAPLQEERRVDERVVVEPERRVDHGLRVADRAGGERAERGGLGVPRLEFEARLRASCPRPCGRTSGRRGSARLRGRTRARPASRACRCGGGLRRACGRRRPCAPRPRWPT